MWISHGLLDVFYCFLVSFLFMAMVFLCFVVVLPGLSKACLCVCLFWNNPKSYSALPGVIPFLKPQPLATPAAHNVALESEDPPAEVFMTPPQAPNTSARTRTCNTSLDSTPPDIPLFKLITLHPHLCCHLHTKAAFWPAKAKWTDSLWAVSNVCGVIAWA